MLRVTADTDLPVHFTAVLQRLGTFRCVTGTQDTAAPAPAPWTDVATARDVAVCYEWLIPRKQHVWLAVAPVRGIAVCCGHAHLERERTISDMCCE